MATCTATIKSGKRRGEFCGKRLRGREFCGYHDGNWWKGGTAPKPKRRPRRRVPPPPEGERCSICFDGMSEKYTKLGCGHYYHTECIADWFRVNVNRECCLCREIDVGTVIPGLEVVRPPAPISPTSPSYRPALPPSGVVIVIDDDDEFIGPDIPPSFEVPPSFELLLRLYHVGVRIEDLNMLIRGGGISMYNRYEE